MYDDIYQSALEDELEKIALFGGLRGKIDKKSVTMGQSFLRTMRGMPRSFGAGMERMRRARQVMARSSRAPFVMGRAGDLSIMQHQSMARKHFERSGVPALGRAVGGTALLGGGGLAAKKYMDFRNQS